MSRDLTCNSEDGDAAVIALRKLGHDFPAEVTWSTRDGDALMGQHYESEGGKIQRTIAIWGHEFTSYSSITGKLKFKPGETERTIRIPLVNDPTGETRHFYVILDKVKGRDKLGDVTECKVKISSEASKLSTITCQPRVWLNRS